MFSDDACLTLSNTEKRYEVTKADLPLCCPMPNMKLWNSHPRVYITLDNIDDRSNCPYCGALYVLKES